MGQIYLRHARRAPHKTFFLAVSWLVYSIPNTFLCHTENETQRVSNIASPPSFNKDEWQLYVLTVNNI